MGSGVNAQGSEGDDGGQEERHAVHPDGSIGHAPGHRDARFGHLRGKHALGLRGLFLGCRGEGRA
jgi:hypothetical protein